MFLKDIAIIEYSLPVKMRDDVKSNYQSRWLNVSGLMPNNKFVLSENVNSLDANKALKAESNCILLKRISPTFVNVYEGKDDVCLGTNIIKIKVSDKYDAHYVGLIIEQNLKFLNNQANNGTRMCAMVRESLECIEIPSRPLAEQKKIGLLQKLFWEQKDLLEQLIEKQELKCNTIKGLIIDKVGGKQNGN